MPTGIAQQHCAPLYPHQCVASAALQAAGPAWWCLGWAQTPASPPKAQSLVVPALVVVVAVVEVAEQVAGEVSLKQWLRIPSAGIQQQQVTSTFRAPSVRSDTLLEEPTSALSTTWRAPCRKATYLCNKLRHYTLHTRPMHGLLEYMTALSTRAPIFTVLCTPLLPFQPTILSVPHISHHATPWTLNAPWNHVMRAPYPHTLPNPLNAAQLSDAHPLLSLHLSSILLLRWRQPVPQWWTRPRWPLVE